jgi:sugar/nucleoside kinase (ribokinase family)
MRPLRTPLPVDARPLDLLVVGELNVDLLLRGDVTPAFGQAEKLVDNAVLTIGSSSAIFACGAARLGLRTAFVGVAGDDVFGHFLVAALSERGIDARGVTLLPQARTGLTVHLTRADGDRAMLTHLGAIEALAAHHIPSALVQQARHLHLGSYFLHRSLRADLPPLFAAARAKNLTVSMDTNYDPAEQWDGGVHAALDETDLFLPNETEAMAIAKQRTWQDALVMLARQVPLVALKRGAAGAVARAGAAEWRAPTIAVDVVDTTGAGDSFDAGFVFGYLAGWPVQQSLALATVCGALSTRAAGGTAAQPTLEEALAHLGP